MRGMSYSFLIFDFGNDEEIAQQARHRIDGWKQAFRLDKKLQVKFDRRESVKTPEAASAQPPKTAKPAQGGKGKTGAKAKPESKSDSKAAQAPVEPSQIHVMVRLDFSDHEKLSHHRWLERIPTEEPFKSANPKIVRAGESEFKETSELFDSLD
jgi:hypothetical protein